MRGSSRRRFFWQAFFILLPVCVLATAGFVLLRQDKRLVEHEAASRAQDVASSLLDHFWIRLTTPPTSLHLGEKSFAVDEQGNLDFPPEFEPAPPLSVDHFDVTKLSEEQLGLWRQIETMDSARTGAGKAGEVITRFLESQPPTDFAAVAKFTMALLFQKEEENQRARELLAELLEKFPGARSESGLPLAPLARFKLLELNKSSASIQPGGGALESFCSNLVYYPTALTPALLERAALLPHAEGVAKWAQLWDQHEQARALYHQLRHGSELNQATGSAPFAVNRFAWLEIPEASDDRWLAVGFEEVPGGAFPPGYSVPTSLLNSHQLRSRFELRPPRDKNATAFYFNSPASTSPRITNHLFVCQSDAELAQQLSDLREVQRLPDYCSVGVQIAGEKIRALGASLRQWAEVSYAGKGGGVRKTFSANPATNMLATAVRTETGHEQLRVNVYLASPSALYKHQNARLFWFQVLLAVSFAMACAGVAGAWRVFNQERELNELKTNFVSSVSHELRAPIASVRLMAENLEHGKVQDDSKQAQYFRFIGQECRRLSSLVENVLDFSRIEQGRKRYNIEPTDLLGLTRETVLLMQTYAADKHVALSLREPEAISTPSELPIDGRAMQQALVNLIDNAVKHSPAGQSVLVGLEKRNGAAQPAGADNTVGAVLLWVEDHGPGIASEEQEKIFERFYRIGSELRRDTQGVGIGLSIVKHIVEAHHGRVTVKSSPGAGSRFTIELPLNAGGNFEPT